MLSCDREVMEFHFKIIQGRFGLDTLMKKYVP